MIFINRQETDPYFNIAAEEYIFHKFRDNVCSFWINEPSVIIGKHQNAYAEVNLDFLNKMNIPVIRRLSGGGTVYHDKGNLNFTFIRKKEGENLIDYELQTKPIIQALAGLSIQAKLEGKSDLTINGLKFSGNSEHIYKDRVLHHGTLLFDSNLDSLEKTLELSPATYVDKGVRSIRSTVTNIADHLSTPVTIHSFRAYLLDFLMKGHKDSKLYIINKEDRSEIQKLVKEKYKRWVWNFGYSPKYRINNTFALEHGNVSFELEVSNGIIKDVHFSSDKYDLKDFGQALRNTEYRKDKIREKLLSINFAEHVPGIVLDHFVNKLF